MEVMVDLETLSTRGHSAILVIAGIKFNRNERHVNIENMDTFYRKVKINSCRSINLHIDEKTVKWWSEQDAELQNEIFSLNDRVTIEDALKELTEWFGKAEKVWCQGANFDVPILDEAYARCGLTSPWKFWNVRDTRTLYEIAGISSKDLPSENKHHPLHDCWRQIWGVKEAVKKLKNKN